MEYLQGEIKDFPIEVVQKMLEYQEIQTGNRDVTIFQKRSYAGMLDAGFTWIDTPEDVYFWCDVIIGKKFDVFFEKYPKVETIKYVNNFNKYKVQKSKLF